MHIGRYEDLGPALLRGEAGACAAFLEARRAADGDTVEYGYWLAQLHYRCGRFVEALEICFGITRRHATFGFHVHTLGDVCGHLGLRETGYAGLDALCARPEMQGEPAYHVRLCGAHYLGDDAAVLGVPRGGGIREACLNEHYRGRSLMRLHGVAAGVQAFYRSYCSREAVAEIWPDEDTGTFWDGQQALPRRLVVRGFSCGFGDFIQWLRYARALQALGVEVGWDSVFDGLAGEVRLGEHDYRMAAQLGAAGLACGRNDAVMWTTPFTLFGALFPVLGYAGIPRYIEPRPDPEVMQQLKEIRARAKGRPCVAIFWSSCGSNDMYARKSLLHRHLEPLWEGRDDVHWVILQRGYERGVWSRSRYAADTDRFSLVPEQLGLAQVFAVLDGLDGLVANDGVLAHAAGAMGRPVCLLLNAQCADWRYAQEDTATGWYASARVLRPRAMGQWDTLVERLTGDPGCGGALPWRQDAGGRAPH